MNIRILLTAVFLSASSAVAAEPSQQGPLPWDKDKQLLDIVTADVNARGIMAVAPHRDDMERALSGAPQAFVLAAEDHGGVSYVFTDGPANALLSLIMASSAKGKSTSVVAIPDPYPDISLYLGSYYDEVGKPDEALRVLDEGLALPNAETGSHSPELLIERGAALASLKRWPDSLASYDNALKIPGVPPQAQAYMYRGRGFALIEMGRLDEAAESYTESLKLDPGNARVQHELDYIASLRKGAMPAAPSLTKVQPDAAPAPDTQH